MENQLDRRMTHWGEAAFLFSFDLAKPVLALIFPSDVKLARVRDVFRQAILQNRAAIASGKGNYYLRDLVVWLAKDEEWVNPITEFIQTSLVSKSYPEHRTNIPSNFLYDDDVDEKITAMLRLDEGPDTFRNRYLSELPLDPYDELLAATKAIDSALETSRLSSWDGEILVRNREIYGMTDPLRSLIFSADMYIRKKTMEQVILSTSDHSLAEILALDTAS